MRNPLITLANWQDPVANRWGFCHVRELIPTARIGRGDGDVSALGPGIPLDPDEVIFDFRGRQFSASDAIDASYTDAIIVVHRGRIVFEYYGPEMSPARTHLLMSVSKSMTSTLAGVLVGEGLLSTQDLVSVHVEELRGTGFEGCTVQHLLDMRAGVRFSEDYADLDADVRIYEQVAGLRPRATAGLAQSLYDYMPTLPRERAHGGSFEYQSILTDVLGWVLERAGAMPFAELLSDRLWMKMGAEHDAEVTVDSRGCALADGGVCTTLRDLARFGLLQLRGGALAGRQVVPPAWVSECTRRDPQLVAAFSEKGREGYERFAMYHNNWWVLDPAGPVSAGIGINGQLLYLDAPMDTVVAKFSSWPRALDAEFGNLHFALAEALAQAAHRVGANGAS
jgi:hypothetical protein